MKICIDSGHSRSYAPRNDSGQVNEVAVNKAVSKELGTLLQLFGYEIMYTRTDDLGVYDLEFNGKVARDLGADVFVSIHSNFLESTASDAIEIFHYPDAKEGKQLAEGIQAVLAKIVSVKERNVKEENYGMLRFPDMPAVLVEFDFLIDEEKQMILAFGIATGINRYFVKGLTIGKNNHIMENNMKAKMNMPREKALTAWLSAH